MVLKTLFSLELDADKAISEIASQIHEANIIPKHILYFLSSDFDQQAIAEGIYSKFKCDCIGITSSGEYYNDSFFQKSIVAIAFDDDFFADFEIMSMDISEGIAFDMIEKKCLERFGKNLGDFGNDECFGMVLVDVSDMRNSEKLDAFTDDFQMHTMIPLIGGMAGDYGKMTRKYVHINGKIYQNHLILGIYKPNVEFEFMFTHNHRPTDFTLFPTEFGANNRTVKKYNNVIAGDAFCDSIGFDRHDLPEGFLNKFTIAQEVFNNHFFVNHISDILPDGTMLHHGRVKENSELTIMQCGDIVLDTKNAIRLNKARDKEKFARIIGVIEYSCRARTEELKSEKNIDRYSKLFDFAPHIGISTDTEIYFSAMNYTSVSLLFYK